MTSIVRPARVDMSFEPLLKLLDELDVIELGPELLLSLLFPLNAGLLLTWLVLLLLPLLLSVITMDCA